MTLRITFNPGTRLLADGERSHLVYRDGVNELCNTLIANDIRPDLVAMARERARAGYYAQAYVSDAALRDLLKSGDVVEVEVQDDSLLGRIAGEMNRDDHTAWHEEGLDVTEPDHHIIPAPGAVPAVVEDEEEYAREWDGGE